MKVTKHQGESSRAIAETNKKRSYGLVKIGLKDLRQAAADMLLVGMVLFTAMVIGTTGLVSKAHGQRSNPVFVQITGDTHVRVAGSRAGRGLLVSETTLPRGSVVEIYAKSYNQPVRHHWWNLTHQRDPIEFVQGVRIISAPGFTKQEIDELNRLNAQNGLYMAKSELRQGRLVQVAANRRHVGLSRPAEVMFNETNRSSGRRNNSRTSRVDRSRDNATAFDQATAGLRQATAAVSSAGRAGAPQGRCDIQGVYQRALQAGVPDRPLKHALGYFNKNKSRLPNQRYITIVDFTQPSSAKRMFIIDTTNGHVTRHFSAHGIGSDGSGARASRGRMSNRTNSHATPPGFHMAAETYTGSKGLSMRLNGLESRNSNSRSRGIVVHGANYATPEFVRRVGRLGRSWGCPAVDPRELRDIVGRIRGGSLFYNYNGE